METLSHCLNYCFVYEIKLNFYKWTRLIEGIVFKAICLRNIRSLHFVNLFPTCLFSAAKHGQVCALYDHGIMGVCNPEFILWLYWIRTMWINYKWFPINLCTILQYYNSRIGTWIYPWIIFNYKHGKISNEHLIDWVSSVKINWN